jgi:hypothetical protein
MSLHNRPGSRERRGERCAAVVSRLYMDLTRVELVTAGKGNEEKSARGRRRGESGDSGCTNWVVYLWL